MNKIAVPLTWYEESFSVYVQQAVQKLLKERGIGPDDFLDNSNLIFILELVEVQQ